VTHKISPSSADSRYLYPRVASAAPAAYLKRGDTYWYQFQFNGERIQQSAQTSNKDAARQIEAAHRVRLAKDEAGILERPPAPTLKEFALPV
jgi:hypothetical protein